MLTDSGSNAALAAAQPSETTDATPTSCYDANAFPSSTPSAFINTSELAAAVKQCATSSDDKPWCGQRHGHGKGRQRAPRLHAANSAAASNGATSLATRTRDAYENRPVSTTSLRIIETFGAREPRELPRGPPSSFASANGKSFGSRGWG